MHYLKTLYWLSVRVWIITLAVLGMLTMGLSCYLLGPLYSRMLFNDYRFWRHHRQFFPATMHLWKLAFKMIAEPRYRKMTALMSASDWLDGPRRGPIPGTAKVREDWPHPADTCGTCNRCCTVVKCPLHEADTGFCKSYASPFWDYFPCGRYPATQAQVDYYECPKWDVIAKS